MIFPNITNDPEQKQQRSKLCGMYAMVTGVFARFTAASSLESANFSLDIATQIVVNAAKAISFWNALTDADVECLYLVGWPDAGWVNLYSKVHSNGCLISIDCEATMNGDDGSFERRITRDGVATIKSRMASDLWQLMCEYDVEAISFYKAKNSARDAESCVSVRVNGAWVKAFTKFNRWRVRHLAHRTLLEATRSISRELRMCKEALARLSDLSDIEETFDGENAATIERDLSAFDTDENPCEVGFESF